MIRLPGVVRGPACLPSIANTRTRRRVYDFWAVSVSGWVCLLHLWLIPPATKAAANWGVVIETTIRTYR